MIAQGSAQVPSRSLIVIMGVSGCGKSTIGDGLARQNGWSFLEGDDYHPHANIAAMASGRPLTDHDRAAWVDALRTAVDAHDAPVLVLACSALTAFVQTGLMQSDRRVLFAYLKADAVDLLARMTNRDHFMPAALLPSQLATLCVPDAAFKMDASEPPDQIVETLTRHFQTTL